MLEERTCRPYGAHALEVALGYKHAALTALCTLLPLEIR